MEKNIFWAEIRSRMFSRFIVGHSVYWINLQLSTSTEREQNSGRNARLKRRISLGWNTAVLRKNVVWAFENCQISFTKMYIFQESYEYFPFKFSKFLSEIAKKMIWKIRRKIFIILWGHLRFIEGNLATRGGSYGVFPQDGRIMRGIRARSGKGRAN